MTSSYRSPKTLVRGDAIEGRGLFAVETLSKGEIVAIKGGHVIDRKSHDAHHEVIGDADLQIADGFYLAPLTPAEHDAVMMFLNHSCEPNTGVMGNIVFVTMREVTPGEELTVDYAMIDDGDFEMECRCGTASCRRRISGRDWRLPELQRRYRGYFSAYLARRIEHGSS